MDMQGPSVDAERLAKDRLARLQAELARRDIAAALLFDPVNIRYATGTRNMAVWSMHNLARYCLVPAAGKAVLFDFHNCEHLSRGAATVAEVRRAVPTDYFGAGDRLTERLDAFAREIADLMGTFGGRNRRLAVDVLAPMAVARLERLGLALVDARGPIERARVIKTHDEVACLTAAVAACEAGMARMRERLAPGITENQLWAVLHETNIALGGEWIETRLLSSGSRTNPWFQECSDRVIGEGEIVSFDTDLIGPSGYCADLSRSFLCGGSATPEMKRLYGIALDQLHHNIALLKPGLGFRELAETAFPLPQACRPNRYSVIAHGVGLCDEYPGCAYLEDFERAGYDGELVAGMALCVESYVGEVGGPFGVKLEEQVLVTEAGVVQLSRFPYEEALMVRQV
jgi:Xaa-Pro aminopeptidase